MALFLVVFGSGLLCLFFFFALMWSLFVESPAAFVCFMAFLVWLFTFSAWVAARPGRREPSRPGRREPSRQ